MRRPGAEGFEPVNNEINFLDCRVIENYNYANVKRAAGDENVYKVRAQWINMVSEV